MKIYLKIFLFITIIISSGFIALSVFAATYTPLEPNAFPGITTDSGSSAGLIIFLGQVFSYGIAIAVVLALVMIIWGGIMYMTTDSWTGKDDGKKKILDAVQGLGLALISYLVLYTINPCIVTFTRTDTCNNTFLNPQTSVTQYITPKAAPPSPFIAPPAAESPITPTQPKAGTQ